MSNIPTRRQENRSAANPPDRLRDHCHDLFHCSCLALLATPKPRRRRVEASSYGGRAPWLQKPGNALALRSWRVVEAAAPTACLKTTARRGGQLYELPLFFPLSRDKTIPMDLDGIDHVAMSVSDVERSALWYIEVLGFERRHEGMWNSIPVFIGRGTTAIALFPVKSKTAGPSSSPRGPHMLHLAFRATHEGFLIAQRELRERGIAFEFQDHEISHSIYFRDPDGHHLEITTYELNSA